MKTKFTKKEVQVLTAQIAGQIAAGLIVQDGLRDDVPWLSNQEIAAQAVLIADSILDECVISPE